MTISSPEDFATLLTERFALQDIIHFKVFMGLMSTLNRGCKCNKKQKYEQLEQAYKTTLLKNKDNELLKSELREFLNGNEEQSITFYLKEEEIFSFKL